MNTKAASLGRWVYVALLALLPGACTHRRNLPPAPGAAAAATRAPGAFADVTEQAGLRFTQTNGAAGRFLLVETTPGGCAFLDYDRDGWLDAFFVQSGPPPGSPPGAARPPCALYRNNGDGTFRDVTAAAGLDQIDQGYAQGVAVGDCDNDGFPDLFLTAYGGCRLLRNDKGARFIDATKTAGVAGDERAARWATGAAWGDYDRDGDLDLIVTHYAPWTPADDKACTNARGRRTYCSPEVYDPETPRLYRNDGKARFTDVTAAMGLDRVQGRGLGVVWLDYDQDGWPDLFIACDMTPNLLLRNRGGKRFEEIGLAAGVAYGPDATVLAGMGIAVGDYDNSGRQSLLITNFSNQPNVLFRNAGAALFEDATFVSGIGQASMKYLAWGAEFLDYDNDGQLDLIVGNGHVDPFIADAAPETTYRERKLLFRNQGNGRFRDASEALGDLAEERVTRGLAVGDFDNDGRVDVLDNSHNLPARLYRNVGKESGHFVTFRLEGVQSNRDATGALVWVTVAGRRRVAEVRNGSSYASTSDRRLHFGLGAAARIDKVEVRWPSGRHQTFAGLAADTFYYLREGAVPLPDPEVK